MSARHGLQAEILASLSMVLLTAVALPAGLLLRTHEAHLDELRVLAARALLAEAADPSAADAAARRWWVLTEDGSLEPRGHGETAGPELRAFAEAVRGGRAQLEIGPPWEPVRFAAPLPGQRVAVALLPPTVSRGLVLLVLCADAAIFSVFGAYLLRRRLIRPLQRLAARARSVADGDLETRAPLDGVRETAELAAAFNEMTEGLESRTRALEKAVGELRESNRRLRDARDGLDRAEKLAAVGRLAAGVAHEVGNPMGAVLAFLDLARRSPELVPETRAFIDRAAREGERVRVILRQLLDFSRPPRRARAPVEIGRVCRETADLVRAQRAFAGVAVEIRVEDGTPHALADPGSAAQIVLNLLLNAAHAAVRGSPEPRIEIRVEPAVLRQRQGDGPGPAAGRRRPDAVCCHVRDNGPGIEPEDRGRIFDPFFSTKEVGEGTGLGLSNALRFAEELGGRLTLLDTPSGEGAHFALLLPAVREDAEPVATRATGA